MLTRVRENFDQMKTNMLDLSKMFASARRDPTAVKPMQDPVIKKRVLDFMQTRPRSAAKYGKEPANATWAVDPMLAFGLLTGLFGRRNLPPS